MKLCHADIRRASLLAFLALMSGFQHGHALSQTYCSSENTGSDYSVVSDIYQSNGACYDQCLSSYAFAVVQYQQCWCSNYAPADQLDVSDCSTNCPGYPAEDCGNSDEDYFGYIALTLSPSGTSGASSAAASSTQASTSTTESSSAAPTTTSTTQVVNTVYSSVSVTVYQTVEHSASTVVSYITASSTAASTTSSSSISTTSTTSVSTTPTPTSTSSSSTSAIAATTQAATTSSGGTSTTSHTTLISTRVITISGAPVTQTVTSTPIAGSDPDTQDAVRKGISGGTVAGAVIGAVVGVALLLLGAFFLWRKRRNNADEKDVESPPKPGSPRRMERNISVLSKTGLLAAAGTGDAEKNYDDPVPYINTAGRNQRYAAYGNGELDGHSPVSPAGAASSDGLARRDSRPLFYDQRLNPAALMQHWENNGSRASIGTMQDQRDYSRPLNVTNPDPVDD